MGYCVSRQEIGITRRGREARGGGALHGVVQTQVFEEREEGQFDDVRAGGIHRSSTGATGAEDATEGVVQGSIEPCRASDFQRPEEEYLKKYEERKEGVIDGGSS